MKYLNDKEEIINNKFLLEEKIDDNTLTLHIYDETGKSLATYETIVDNPINSISYDLINENYILIELFDSEYNSLYKAIIDSTSGKVLAEGNDTKTYVKKQLLNKGYYFYGKDNNLTIKDSDDRIVSTIEGQDLIYLNGNYFAVKDKTGKYYICKVILEQEQVK